MSERSVNYTSCVRTPPRSPLALNPFDQPPKERHAMTSRESRTLYIFFLLAVFSAETFGISLTNGNFLLASDNLVVQITRTGDVVDGLFPPNEETLAVGVGPCGDIVVGAYEWLSSYALRRIYKMSTNGSILSANDPPLTFDTFTVAPNGNFLIGNGTAIVRTDFRFGFLDVFAVPAAPGSAPAIGGIAAGLDGNVYAIARARNPPRATIIHKLDAQGNLLQSSGPYGFDIQGLAVDTNNHLFYATLTNDLAGFRSPSDIVELDTNGVEIARFSVPIPVVGMTIINLATPPKLSIRCDGCEIILEWAETPIEYELIACSPSTTLKWDVCGTPPVASEGLWRVKLPITGTDMLFRLRSRP